MRCELAYLFRLELFEYFGSFELPRPIPAY
jgi:hypothetical protein